MYISLQISAAKSFQAVRATSADAASLMWVSYHLNTVNTHKAFTIIIVIDALCPSRSFTWQICFVYSLQTSVKQVYVS